MRSRRSRVPSGTPASPATASTTVPYAAKAQKASRGVATTASTNTKTAAILSWGGSRWTPRVARG